MEIFITGIPLMYWDALREPIKHDIAQYLDETETRYRDVCVHLFPAYGKEEPIQIAFDRRSPEWPHRWPLSYIVATLCMRHSLRHELWYQGFFFNHLLE